MTQIKPPYKTKVCYRVLTYDDKTTQSLRSSYSYTDYSKALTMFEELSKVSKREYLVELEYNFAEDYTERDYEYTKLLGSNL